MKAVVIENTWLPRSIPGTDFVMNFGWGNGYVVLDEEFKMDDFNEFEVNAYGGITYVGTVGPIHVDMCDQLDESDIGKGMIGFDTAHFEDTLERWPKEAVQAEANRLLEQLQEYKK